MMKLKSAVLSFFLVSAIFIPSLFAAQQGTERMTISSPPLNFDGVVDSELYTLLMKGINTHVVWTGDVNLQKIALTFDDGPNATYTNEILTILEQQKIPATFFLIGQHAQQYPDLVKKIFQAGHEIGNHTYSHIELIKASSPDIKTEIEKTREIIKDITGQTTVLFRPPWGLFDGRSLAELALRKFDVVLWSVDSMDWSRPGAAAIKDNILSKVRNGSIILCHDDHDQIVSILPEIIRTLKEKGYQFVTVPEMIESSALDGQNLVRSESGL